MNIIPVTIVSAQNKPEIFPLISDVENHQQGLPGGRKIFGFALDEEMADEDEGKLLQILTVIKMSKILRKAIHPAMTPMKKILRKSISPLR